MNRTTIIFAGGLMLATALPVGPAQALAARSFVSATNGSDSNLCSRSEPCRTFAFAYTQTLAGGEINTLDPGGYGPLTIDHSISIVSGVGEAGVLVTGPAGITINAGPNDNINLRGLIIEGAGVGTTGILLNSGGSLTITNCVVRNLTGTGIAIANSNGFVYVSVSDTLLSDNGGDGLYIQPSNADIASASAVLNRVDAHHNGQEGIAIYGNVSSAGVVYAIVIDCISGQNGQWGYRALAAQSSVAYLRFYRSTAFQNGSGGVSTEGTGVVALGQSILEFQFGSICLQAINGGTIYTYGDNFTAGCLITSPSHSYSKF